MSVCLSVYGLITKNYGMDFNEIWRKNGLFTGSDMSLFSFLDRTQVTKLTLPKPTAIYSEIWYLTTADGQLTADFTLIYWLSLDIERYYIVTHLSADHHLTTLFSYYTQWHINIQILITSINLFQRTFPIMFVSTSMKNNLRVLPKLRDLTSVAWSGLNRSRSKFSFFSDTGEKYS